MRVARYDTVWAFLTVNSEAMYVFEHIAISFKYSIIWCGPQNTIWEVKHVVYRPIII